MRSLRNYELDIALILYTKMVIGRIDWFGGQNNKTQTINDFGFIIPIDGANNKGIYVHRNDVPIDLQDIIEGKRGKGAGQTH